MNILILLKNSALDESIVNFTASVFNASSVKLHLLNIVEVNGEIPTKPTGEVLDFCTEFDLSNYHATAAKNSAYLSTIENDLILNRQALVGNRIKLIQHYISDHSIDLIVGGAHKTSRLEDLFIKTFASSIIEKIDLPFLSIKCNRDTFKPSKIGLIQDFNQAKVENHKVLKELIELHKSEVALIKIKTAEDKRSNQELETNMTDYSTENSLNANNIILEGINNEEVMKVIANDHLVDLLVIRKTQRNGLLSFLGRAESSDLVNHINAPILIY